jgi:hypothetical protein
MELDRKGISIIFDLILCFWKTPFVNKQGVTKLTFVQNVYRRRYLIVREERFVLVIT